MKKHLKYIILSILLISSLALLGSCTKSSQSSEANNE